LPPKVLRNGKRTPTHGYPATTLPMYSNNMKRRTRILFTLVHPLRIIILKPTLILFKSLDKNALNQFVASLRSLKTPDSYKGKGLRYVEEKITLKVGKT
jgi:large subunit ribosomal protein L6